MQEGTRSVHRIRGLAGQVRVGAPDASLTPACGVVAVAELVGRLGVVQALDDAVGSIKQRDRGLTAGQFLVSLAQAQMLGADFWTHLDRRRDDAAGEALSAVPTPASTTAATLAARFGPAQLAGIEEGIGEICCRVMDLLPARRRAGLRAGTVTIDLDGTDVECYGSEKDGIAYTYKGMRAGRPHVATWAEAGLVAAADLLAGDEDPRPGAGGLIERSVATLRAAGVTARPRVRGDVGYFAKDIAWAAVDNGCDFSLGITRNPAAWRAAAAIADDAWTEAVGMKDIPGRRGRLRPGRLATRHRLPGAPGTAARRGHLERPAGPPPPHDPERPARPRPAGSGRARVRVLVHRHQRRCVHPGQGRHRRGVAPDAHRHRRPYPRRQTRRRAAPSPIRQPDGQHGMDVGCAAGRQPVRLATGTVRPGLR